MDRRVGVFLPLFSLSSLSLLSLFLCTTTKDGSIASLCVQLLDSIIDRGKSSLVGDDVEDGAAWWVMMWWMEQLAEGGCSSLRVLELKVQQVTLKAKMDLLNKILSLMQGLKR